MPKKGFLGIDAGTQGLSVVFADSSLNVLATGNGSYEMVPDLDSGCYEQRPEYWTAALREAMADLRTQLAEPIDVLAIGISGQMHGEVLIDKHNRPLGPARLWCDSRNESEGHQLTQAMGVKMPKRITSARWLATLRNRPDVAARVAHLTTPAGWLAFELTGQWVLGIGDAAGMFPIDSSTFNYDTRHLAVFDALAGHSTPIADLMPTVRVAGQSGGNLTVAGAEILNLPEGVPVAPSEGDQPAALAGSLIADAGMVSVSFGTSVCANSIGDRPFQGVNRAVDHFCAPDGKPINMICLRNGTTFMNTIVKMFGKAFHRSLDASFESVMPLVLNADPDCGGLMALPFMDDEPGLGIGSDASAMIVGLHADNASPGNMVKAALLATIFNLRIGSQVLDEQGFPRSEIVLSGGLTKTPELAQIMADVFNTPVNLLASSEEGTAWGATLLAKFRHLNLNPTTVLWPEFLKQHSTNESSRCEPNPESVVKYHSEFLRYEKLLANAEGFSEP